MPDSEFWGHVAQDRELDAAIRDLLQSNESLRAAIIVAGKEIRRLNFGKKDSVALDLLRGELRKAREVAKRYKR